MNDFWNDGWLAVLGRIGLVIVILIVTWIVARLVKGAIGKLVERVDALQRPGADGKALGDSIGTIGSLLVWLFGLIAVLQVLSLQEVLTPISSMLNTFLNYLPNIVGAGFIFFIGYVIAKILRQLVTTALSTVRFDGLIDKVKKGAEDVTGTAEAAAAPERPATPQAPAAEQAQQAAAAEQAQQATQQFAADQPTAEHTAVPPLPVQGTPQQGVPQQGVPQQGVGQQGVGQGGPQGAAPQTAPQGWQQPQQQPAAAAQPATADSSSPSIPQIVGNLVFAVVIIVVSIAALQVLGITAISDPAQQMLTMVLNAIPLILAAVIILGIGYLIARFVGDLLESTLKGLGTDRAVGSLGIVPEGQSASVIITRVAQVAIMVFFAIMAARLLNFPEVSAILDEILSIGGRVVFGGLIIAAGFIIARLISNAMGAGTASTVVKYATIVLFAAMGLRYMGLADSIINLAFGAVVVGGALAAALAYGIGGRDAAARSLEKLQRKEESGGV